MSDPRYPESCAYREAGHIVVAAAQGMPLGVHGAHVAPDGRGISYYSFRKRGSRGFDKEGEHTIISVFAGLIAQQKFHPSCSTAAASKDQTDIDQLLAEMYLDGTPASEITLSEASLQLREEANRLVNEHWIAIEALGKALWARPLTPRNPSEPEKTWSLSPEEKTIDGAGIVAILKKFGICASRSEK